MGTKVSPTARHALRTSNYESYITHHVPEVPFTTLVAHLSSRISTHHLSCTAGVITPFIHHTPHITHHTSHITHYTLHITHHTSHITHHTSHITHYTSHITHHIAFTRYEVSYLIILSLKK